MKTSITILKIVLLLLIPSCKKEEHRHATAEFYYTCPMHPSVRSDKPGACPICNMALVKVEVKNERREDHSNMVMLNVEKQILANITIDTVKSTIIKSQTTFVGKASANENKATIITARVKGRIDRLFVRQEGEQIITGQALYSIYSEALLADQNDYLSAIRQRNKFSAQQAMVKELIQAGRKKLQLWGMNEDQINKLEPSQEASALITYHSDYSGFITKLFVNEGEYTEIGKPLFQLTDLGTVWIEAEVYPDEVKYLNDQTEASIKIEALPQETFKGRIVFENPALEDNSKINLVRFWVNNGRGLIKPGMMARVTIDYNPKETLVVPKEALLIGIMKMLWVEVEPGMYEGRTVETGIENKSFVEILSGLKEGDRVVTSGAYLLNSEFILKNGAVKNHSH
jgi:membrane fusion protein, copper/silver efflux system